VKVKGDSAFTNVFFFSASSKEATYQQQYDEVNVSHKLKLEVVNDFFTSILLKCSTK